MRIPKGGIAFFDSGIGGMTVLSACMKLFKNEIFYYYGDNAHAPYGNLSEQRIKKYVNRAFQFFSRKRVKAVVIACNTVTAICIEELRKKYPFPIIGAEPALMEAVRLKLSLRDFEKPIYVLMTRGTYNSKRFQCLYNKISHDFPSILIKAFPCDNLAGEIERNAQNPKFNYNALLPAGNPQIVVLGCTHYIYIKKNLERYYHCRCVDGNNGIARRLMMVLNEKGYYYKKEKVEIGKHIKNEYLATTADPKCKNMRKNAKLHKKTKTNKCSHFLRKSAFAFICKRGQNYIYFCGSGKRYNALFYKQMFGFNEYRGENS